MTPEKEREAFRFIFEESGKGIWWLPQSLTKSGNPNGNPPDLNPTEAESIFHILIRKGLLLPYIVPDNPPFRAWIINECREKQWKDLIDPPKPPMKWSQTLDRLQ